MAAAPPADGDRDRGKLLSLSFAVNAGGIYACFMSCSLLHEAIYRPQAAGEGVPSPWVVNSVEAALNVLVAALGVGLWEGRQPWLPQRALASTGCLQVVAKYCASSSRVHGVPGPVMTLMKTARPLPVMLGQRLIAGTRYTARDYLQYMLIVAASVLVGGARSPLPGDRVSRLGIIFLLFSMFCDGYVGGRQKQLKSSVRAHRRMQGLASEDLKPFELQLFTNLYMLGTAAAFAAWLGEFVPTARLLLRRPGLLWSVLRYAACSAVGQVFVFSCMTQTDPLILSIVTSSRKIASVVLTLVVFGYEVDGACLAGLVLAVLGFALILVDETKRRGNGSRHSAVVECEAPREAAPGPAASAPGDAGAAGDFWRRRK